MSNRRSSVRRLPSGLGLLQSICSLNLLTAILLTAILPARATDQEIAPSEVPPSSEVPSDELPAESSPEEAAANQPPRPLSEAEQELVNQFEAQRAQWAETLMQMRAHQIRYSNGIDRSDENLQQFAELRDRGRIELHKLYSLAETLFEARRDYFDAASLLATVLDYRLSNSVYENSYKATKMLLDAEVTMPFLYIMAARSAFLEGHFDEVIPFYQTYVDEHGADKLDKVDHQIAGAIEAYRPLWEEELERRAADAQADNLPRVLLETTRGPILVELFEDSAPNTVANFIQLVESGFYDGNEFYQVIDNLLAMTGDPSGDGTGTSGRYIPDEHERPDRRRIFRGSLFMAKVSASAESSEFVPNTASSQFIIALMPILPKELSQTVFGRVIEGMDVIGSFQRVDPQEKKEDQVQLPPDRIISARVIRKRDHAYPVTYTR